MQNRCIYNTDIEKDMQNRYQEMLLKQVTSPKKKKMRARGQRGAEE
jgi:hypothetical protein